MIGALLLLAASGVPSLTEWQGREQAVASVQPATQAEFRQQARVCKVSAEFRADRAFEARLSADGKELLLRDNLSNGRQLQCMSDWANKRHLAVTLLQS